MVAKGTYRNPQEKWCFRPCMSCMRCSQKNCMQKCNGCSGRIDPEGTREPDPDDFCACTQGVLRWVTQEGQLIVSKFQNNPFSGSVNVKTMTEDERDWEAYLEDMREKLDDPNYDPIKVYEEP